MDGQAPLKVLFGFVGCSKSEPTSVRSDVCEGIDLFVFSFEHSLCSVSDKRKTSREG